MEDSGKPPTKHYEVEIQEAEKEIASIQLEVDAVLDEGARDIDYKLGKVRAALERDLHPQEKQRLLAEREILRKDPHFCKYFKVCVRLTKAKIRRDNYIQRAMMMIPWESRPAAPLQEIPALETVAVVGDEKNAESKSLPSCFIHS
jgi:hypothetical protein